MATRSRSTSGSAASRPPSARRGARRPKRSRRRSSRVCARAGSSTTRSCTTRRSRIACATTPTARRRDVLTMAHELGHGLHAALAQPQGVFHQSTPLTLAETASVFGEALVFGRMLDAAADDDSRLSLLAERIDGAIATVFRQMAMNRFEHLVHTTRRGEGELSSDRICELWVQTQAELFGDSVEITDGYRMWWSYVPHFINTPGYVYAYAYGQLLALSVYGRYLSEGESVVPRYLELLAAGGSRSPGELGGIVGID